MGIPKNLQELDLEERVNIAFVFKNFREIDETLNCLGKTSSRTDPFELYTKTNKIIEIRLCEALQIPYYFIIGDPTSQFVETRAYKTYNMYKDNITSLEGLTFFTRGEAVHEVEVEKYILSKKGKVIIAPEDYETIKKWFTIINPRYVNRTIGVYSSEQIMSDKNILIDFTNPEGFFFAKGFESKKGEVLCKNTPLEFPSFMNTESKIFFSELIDIKDIKIEEEVVQSIYRVWVIKGKPVVYSLLGITDTNNYPVSKEIIDYANTFVTSHRDLLPNTYAIDIAEDIESRLYCLNINPMMSSIQYGGVNFALVLKAISKV